MNTAVFGGMAQHKALSGETPAFFIRMQGGVAEQDCAYCA